MIQIIIENGKNLKKYWFLFDWKYYGLFVHFQEILVNIFTVVGIQHLKIEFVKSQSVSDAKKNPFWLLKLFFRRMESIIDSNFQNKQVFFFSSFSPELNEMKCV